METPGADPEMEQPVPEGVLLRAEEVGGAEDHVGEAADGVLLVERLLALEQRVPNLVRMRALSQN